MTRFKISSVIIHLAVWLLFMSFAIIFISQDVENSFLNMDLSWRYVEFFIVYAIIFYLNAWYLFPAFYIRKKYLAYSLSIATLLILVLTFQPFDRLMQQMPRQERQNRNDRRPPLPPGNRAKKFDLNSLIIFVMVIGIGTALRSIKEWQLTEKRAILAEADRANAELSFLKAQINPHFLYNTLNNIYTLCITGSENAAESIMKLSNIMRYITDEAEANFVPLQGEIDCIGNFIDLQKLRLGKKVILNYQLSGNSAGHQISPLILMTFIENIFKYGLSNHTETHINISIDIESDKIIFYSRNRIFKNKNKEERSGLGIKNTKQRLNHLYPQKHTLIIDDQNDLFTVKLILYS